MNYSKYYPLDVLNGEGTRCTLFVSGCIHQCKGCYNQSTWSPDAGELFTEELADQIIADLNDQRIKKQGLSISGGDPLHPANLGQVLRLIKRVKAECINKDIWLWTGYLFSELNAQQQEIVSLIDVLIDGKFIEQLVEPNLVWRGSANQVVHRFDKSVK
ncbi:anaerobic ribonucleoside-triphosphate reductase-activating protein [Psychromonas antarctica]|uniref:anaerobic ribonucleoside-triphosphate reductase-activating protein n=1 Tax=Psychromonas antarctica TaxID=67573 RepID=UPI001EE8A107|nr:anaerobic ribonucleoside-triphosphate reductase-activating protein [Psychromonas antarctica]MCG6199894.1 anaerobic ribonucleoside-triphosphate reductase-activating protein [Psychromonas antarctica]